MVVEAASQRDCGDGVCGFAQKARGGGDAGFGDELAWGEAEEFFHHAGKAMGREPGAPGEGGGGDGIGEMRFEMIERIGDLQGDVVGVDGGADIARDADQADDVAGPIAHGELCGQTPAGFVGGIPVEFEVIEDGAACAQNGGILPRGDAAKIAGADVTRAFAEGLRFFAQAVAGDEGVIYRGVSACGVFDEERDIGNLIEKVLEH